MITLYGFKNCGDMWWVASNHRIKKNSKVQNSNNNILTYCPLTVYLKKFKLMFFSRFLIYIVMTRTYLSIYRVYDILSMCNFLKYNYTGRHVIYIINNIILCV